MISKIKVKDLRKLLPKSVKILEYTELDGKFRSEIFKKTLPIVVIIPQKNESFGHFIVLIPRKKKGYIEYFSSRGKSPFTEVKLLNQGKNIFEQVLGKRFIYNRVELQTETENTCWLWVLLRVKYHKLKLREFISKFAHLRNNPYKIAKMVGVQNFKLETVAGTPQRTVFYNKPDVDVIASSLR